jgi:hypothetical protein
MEVETTAAHQVLRSTEFGAQPQVRLAGVPTSLMRCQRATFDSSAARMASFIALRLDSAQYLLANWLSGRPMALA